MEKIDFEKVYYHTLKTNPYDDMSEDEIYKLESILESKFILARKYLKDKNIILCSFNFNGSDYISLSRKKSKYKSGLSTAYNTYVLNGISIILSEDIKKSLKFRKYAPIVMDGEVQVKDKIPTSYICGLSYPYTNKEEEKEQLREITYILKRHNLKLPIYNPLSNNEEIYPKKFLKG